VTRPGVTERTTTRIASPSALAARVSGSWRSILALYLVSRAFSTLVLVVVYEVAHLADATFITPGSGESFLRFVTAWDADRYRTIALHGYPTVLPRDGSGDVTPNEWAFLPVFPSLAHLLMVGTGMDFAVVALLLATASGAAATILLYRVVADRVGHRPAVWATALFCFGPLSFIFSVGYAEGLSLALLFGGVLAMQRRRYEVVLLCGVVAAFTRPGALALALALAVHLVVRWRAEAPLGDGPGRASLASGPLRGSLPVRELVTIVVAGLAITAAGLAWPVVVHVVTGVPDGYLQTEMAWWKDYVGDPPFVPLTPWFLLAGRWLGVGGIAIVLVLWGSFAVAASRRSTLRLGHEVVGFGVSSFLYVAAVFLPQQSLFRILLPLTPMLGTPAIGDRAWLRRSLLGAGLVLQPVAVVLLWIFTAP